VMELIGQRFKIKLPVGLLVRIWRAGIYPQKPIKKAYEQRPVEVKAWLDNSYPVIAERAKAEGAEIHWEMKLDCAAMTCADVLSHPKEKHPCAGQQ